MVDVLKSVTQPDRDEAYNYMRLIADHRWSHAAILNGGCDNTSVVQAFARHRAASEARLIARLGEPDMVGMLHDLDQREGLTYESMLAAVSDALKGE